MDLEVLSCFILDFENSDQGKRSVMVGQVMVGSGGGRSGGGRSGHGRSGQGRSAKVNENIA